MKKIFVFLFPILLPTLLLKADSSYWDDKDTSNLNWGSGGTTENWSNGIPGVAGGTDKTAIFYRATVSQLPTINGDLLLDQIVFNGTDTLMFFQTNGDTNISFNDSDINQIQFDGQTVITTYFIVGTDQTIKIKDISNGWLTGNSSLKWNYGSSYADVNLIQGSGIVSVQENTVLDYDPTTSNPGTGYQFTGTIDLSALYSTWRISHSGGIFVGQVTSSTENGSILIEADSVFQNSHNFQGLTQLDGKSLTLTAGGSLPYSPIIFAGENASLVIENDATIGGLLQSRNATTPTVSLGVNTLTINQKYSGVEIGGGIGGDSLFTGVISGSGGINITGNDHVKLAGTNLYEGPTVITNGGLNITGSIASSESLTIGPNSVVIGNGIIPTTTNRGDIFPGPNIDTLTVQGDFTQTSTGNFGLEISSTPAASNLDISGTATLDGDLTVSLQKGLYIDGTEVVLLSADGGRTGQFSNFFHNLPTNFQLVYTPTQVQLIVNGHHANVHVATEAIGDKNAYSVANYLLNDLDNSTFNTQIIGYVNKIISNDFTEDQYLEALVSVSPLPVAAVNRTHAQNIEMVARSLDEMFISKAAHHKKIGSSAVFNQTAATPKQVPEQTKQDDKPVYPYYEEEEEEEEPEKIYFGSSYGQNDSGLFAQPYAIFYDQGQLQGSLPNIGQVPFSVYTYGFGLGWEEVFDKNFVFEVGAGYSYTNLHWDLNFGEAHWNSIYLAPFFGWFSTNGFFNAMVLGGFNFTHVSRHVPVEGIDVTAKGNFVAYDVLGRVNGGYRVPLKRREISTTWMQFEGTINSLNIYTQEYTEKGAGSLNLKYQGNWQYFIQPQGFIKWINEVFFDEAVFAPVVKIGWMGTYPIKRNILTSKLALSPTSQFFDIEGYRNINQMVVGGEMFYKSPRLYKVTCGFDSYFLDKSAAFDATVKVEWLF